jgi:hypothetical protein
MQPTARAMKTLAAVGMAVGASEAEMLRFPEEDMRELLSDELGMSVVARNRILEEWRHLKAKSAVITVQARFAIFLERMGASGGALQGIEDVPLSTLPEAVSFIKGYGMPSEAVLRLGVKVSVLRCAARVATQSAW